MNNFNISSEDNEVSSQWKTFLDLKNHVQNIDWLWQHWLPKGFLTILAGESGAGKSAICLRLAGCITNGFVWPDGTPCSVEGFVVWCEAEASQGVNIERAKKWEINLERLILPLDNELEDVNLDNPEHLPKIKEAAMIPSVHLLIVDSLSGANGRDENSSKMLPLVKPLAKIARDTNKAVLLTHHLRKKGEKDNGTVGLDRFRGSSSIIQPARVAWALDHPLSQNEFNRLNVLKSNIGPKPAPIGYKIDGNGVHFGKAPEPTKTMSTSEEAATFLETILKDGPVEASTVIAKATESGIKKRTLENVKKDLGIRSRRVGGANGGWIWVKENK